MSASQESQHDLPDHFLFSEDHLPHLTGHGFHLFIPLFQKGSSFLFIDQACIVSAGIPKEFSHKNSSRISCKKKVLPVTFSQETPFGRSVCRLIEADDGLVMFIPGKKLRVNLLFQIFVLLAHGVRHCQIKHKLRLPGTSHHPKIMDR